VLNARYHEQEAYIIAQAGRPAPSPSPPTWPAAAPTSSSAATSTCAWPRRWPIAADRPTSDRARREDRCAIAPTWRTKKAEALAAGGLYVLGTERHESRRIDNQLRGRSGRQGDPGALEVLLSLEDDLMRIFGSSAWTPCCAPRHEGGRGHHPSLDQQGARKAQQKVEARNFEIRKNLLKYDDVMNDQRKVIFEQRIEGAVEHQGPRGRGR
jgi:preprotein translocase subunit SecA